MDEDFYIEDHYKRNVVIVILIILLVIGGLYYGYKNYYKKNYLKVKDVTVELGSKLSTDIKDYIKAPQKDYQNLYSRIGNKFSKTVSLVLNDGVGYIIEILKSLFS